jgi:dipeptidyl aminopeptidase/acylaminoacyl peptidase
VNRARITLLCFVVSALAGGCSTDDAIDGPAPTGSIQVTTSTTGEDVDPDGYTLHLDGQHSRAMEVNDSEVFADVAAGSHTVELSAVEVNCSVDGNNNRTVNVQGDHTTNVGFSVTCEPLTGSLRVTMVTVGDTLDPDGYRVSVDDVHDQAVSTNGSVTFSGLREGSHTVALSGVAKNCTLTGENPRSVTVDYGQTTEESFSLTCAVALFDHIAFVSTRDGNGEVYVMGADGSNPTNLTNNAAWDIYPDWSPDGTKIIFSSDRTGNDQLYVMNADGSNLSRLTGHPANDISPRWSPDGTKILFATDRDGNYELYVMDVDGSNPTRLTDAPLVDGTPDWSPDGSKIVFYSARDYNLEVYVMNADGSDPVNLTQYQGSDTWPSWSPDGARIVFTKGLGVGFGRSDIHIMNADGSDPINISNHPEADSEPDWSPDGGRIVFKTDRDGYFDIYVMNIDGSNPVRLTNHPAADLTPVWSPMR